MSSINYNKSCESLDSFITSLDQYINPPVKRQRVDEQGQAKRIFLPNLHSFLEMNKEWLPLAKTNATARAKFRELAEKFGTSPTRSSQQVGKRLREEGFPKLPLEMVQEILNIATDQPKKWVPEYHRLTIVHSEWEPLAISALAEKINQEELPIKDLGIEDWLNCVLNMGTKLRFLNLSGLNVPNSIFTQIANSCPHLTALDMEANDLSELGGMQYLEHLELHSKTTELALHTLPSLRTLKLRLIKTETFTIQDQPNLVAIHFYIPRIKQLELPLLPHLTNAHLNLHLVKVLNSWSHLSALKDVFLRCTELLNFKPPEFLEILELKHYQQQLELECPNLKKLIINNTDLERVSLSLGNFTNLSKLKIVSSLLANLKFKSNLLSLKKLHIFSNAIENLNFPNLPSIKKVYIGSYSLQALNFQSIIHAERLQLYAPELRLNLPEDLVFQDDQEVEIITQDCHMEIIAS